MAKPIREVELSRADKFNEIAKDILECKAHIKEVQAYMADKEAELMELCSVVEPTSDFEGTESMQTESYRVGFVYKLSRKVDKEKADEILKELGKKPEVLFTVKYDYSAVLYNLLDDEGRRAVLDSTITKRAKTSIDIKPLFVSAEANDKE